MDGAAGLTAAPQPRRLPGSVPPAPQVLVEVGAEQAPRALLCYGCREVHNPRTLGPGASGLVRPLSTATWAQPPGAPPKSTTRPPGFKILSFSSNWISFIAARDRHPSLLAIFTNGSFACLLIYSLLRKDRFRVQMSCCGAENPHNTLNIPLASFFPFPALASSYM